MAYVDIISSFFAMSIYLMIKSLPLLAAHSNDFHFHFHIFGQRFDRYAGASRLTGKVPRVNLVKGGKVIHAAQKTSGFDRFRQVASRRFQYSLQVFHNLLRLRLNGLCLHRASCRVDGDLSRGKNKLPRHNGL